jgi:phosphonate transport system substrate-binding protein
MSDATPPAPSSLNRRLVHGRHSTLVRIVAFLILAAVIVYVGLAAQSTIHEKEHVRLTEARTVASAGLSSLGHKGLASKFTDSQGRLLADPPASADQYLNPDTIIVAHIDGVGETPGNSWSDWEDHLSQVTGKKVVDQVYTNSADQIAAAGSGKVTLLALHAADTPFLVNNYGFQPVAVLGDDAGVAGNRMDLIVPANSPINKPADLRGRRLTCTAPSSITGYRAAIAVLMHDEGLRPNVDYEITWSLKQKLSIEGVAARKYDAASVSNEKLESTVDKGTIEASQYRIVYQTPVIARTVIGYFYNLNPALAAQLRKAILPISASAAPTSQPTTSPATASTLLRFLPTDYKQDFEFVRNMDDQFDPRFDSKKAVDAD